MRMVVKVNPVKTETILCLNSKDKLALCAVISFASRMTNLSYEYIAAKRMGTYIRLWTTQFVAPKIVLPIFRMIMAE